MSRILHMSVECFNFLNTIFLVLAVLIAGLGVYGHLESDWGSELTGVPLSLSLIAFGGFLFVLCAAGMIAVSRRWEWLLSLYLVLLLMVFIAEIGIVVVAYLFQANAYEQLYQGWKDLDDPTVKDQIGEALGCCGFDSPTEADANCPDTSLPGCFEALETSLTNNLFYVQISLIFIGVVQLLGVCSTMLVIYHMPSKHSDASDSAF